MFRTKLQLELLENLPVMVWMTDSVGKCRYVNSTMLKFTGLTSEECLDREWLNSVPSEDWDVIKESLEKVIVSKEEFELDHRLRRYDGNYRWVMVKGTPIIGENNNFEGFIGTCVDINERKSAEERSLKYKTILEKAGDIILFVDPEGKILDANEAAIEAYGYPRRELLGKTVYELRVDNDKAKHQISEAMRDGAFFQTRHFRKDGSSFPVEVKSRAIKIGEKRVLISFIRDITERLLVKQALAESEEKYKSLFDICTDAIYLQELVDDSSKFSRLIDVNEIACKRLGYTREELLTMHVSDINKNKDPKFYQSVHDILKTRSNFTLENVHLTKEGREIPVEISAHYFEMSGKRYLFSLARDITERKFAEYALRKSEQKFRQLFHNMANGFCYLAVNPNPNTQKFEYIIQEVNASFERLFDVAAEGLIGKNCEDVFISAKQIAQIVNETYHPEKPFDRMTLSDFQTPTGRWYNISIIEPQKGYLAFIVYEVTKSKLVERELVRAKEEAEKASKAKGEFLANMSHEIRTPLNGMLGMVDLTLLSELNEEQRDNLDTAKLCANSLLKIINDILDFSKLEAGKLTIEEVNFNLKLMLQETIKTHKQEARKKGLELRFESLDEVPDYVIGDPYRLGQVLNNLISNALKFTEKGNVTVAIKEYYKTDQGLKIIISVKDTGIGISSQERERLFRSFSQVDSSFTRRFGGTGLGLVISKQLIEMMGGEISVKSVPGKGSNFIFTLSLKEGMQVNVAKQVNEGIKKTENCLKILVAEDDMVNQTFIVKLLREKGHSITTVTTGLEVLDKIKKEQFDLVLMDIQMPQLDGLETAKIIRQLEAQRDGYIPIIALTAYALPGDREKFLNAGMDDYIAKPIDMNLLMKKIDQFSKIINQNNFMIRQNEQGIYHLQEKNIEKDEQNSAEVLEELSRLFNKFTDVIFQLEMDDIEHLIQNLKELAAQIKADNLKGLAFKIQLAARRGEFEAILGLVPEFNRELEKLKQ